MSQRELLSHSEAELVRNFSAQMVCAARRINIRRDGKLLPTQHVVLTFRTPQLPKSMKAGYLKCNVRPYVSNPLSCFQCHKYGHSQLACRGTTPTCAKCVSTDHETNTREANSFKRVNCNGAHSVYSRYCSKWLQEKEIQSVKTKQNISFAQARRIVVERTPKVGLSYSSATKSQTTFSSSQTDS
ncbi:hypothetical protein AVEN_82828-1 [Araneus ventricosus]|uniref:CCHC-type domain-containing protein n=1 Tax=Araneus ventricosus TaxID=182803 RepID=A0A4Y2F831_ARAVE|nr:hypothetical protein AVEN_82828-1 [Araneus ventricosus]